MRRAMLFWPGAALAALALIACDNDRDRALQATTAGAPDAAGARTSVDAIKEAPERFYGKTVRLVGKVDETPSDRAFNLEGTEWAFNDNIAVLTKTPVRIGGAPLAAGDEVVVTGTVRPYSVAEVEREIGWTITPDLEAKIRKRPVLIAQSLRKLDDPRRWSASGAPEPVTTTWMIMTVTEPGSLVGQKVDLGRERVQAVAGKGLWVGQGPMSQVFVLPNQPVKDVKPGDTVRVAGTLQRTPKDAQKAWDLPQNMEGAAGEGTVFVDGATVTKADVRSGG